MRSLLLATSTLAFGVLLGMTGCKNKQEYPACKKDKHCEDGEPCVDGLCQQCQTDDECKGKGPDGGDLACVEFRCGGGDSAGDGVACDPGMIVVDGKCEFCTEDSQCDSGTCNLGSGRCEATACSTDDECPVDEICDGGQCLYHPLDGVGAEAICGVDALYFGFDSAVLSPNNQEQLTAAAACLVEQLASGGTLVLEAHADNVGTEEYNILLTDRRGATVREFLASQSVPDEQMRVVGKGALEAQGSTEQERAKDRRVVFVVEN